MIGLLVMAQIVVVAHAPDTASTCAPVEITVAARAPGAIAPRITLPATPQTLQVLRTSTVSRVERDGAGQSSALTEATFIVATDAVGRIALPPFVATVGTDRASATPGAIDVHGGGSLPPAVVVRAWLDRARRSAASETLYVGQQVDYVVDVHLNESARQRLRRNPTFFPPEMPGVLAYDLAPPLAQRHDGRHCFETLSYRRALFPLFSGPTAIAPAALTYSIPLSTSFFSREESFELRTDSVRFVAVDVPVEGRPANFGGAVGSLGASSRVSTASTRMGDPVVLTLRLEGTGNVKLWPRPPLALPWATIAEGEERVQVDTSEAKVRGSKEFDWLLTPRQPGQKEVPQLDYPYFDADANAYADAHTAPLSLDIATAALATIDSAPAPRLSVRRSLREELPPPVLGRPWYWMLLAIAPAPAAWRRLRRRRRRSVARSAVRRLRQSVSRKEELGARDLRRLFLDAVGERVPATIGSTQCEAFTRALRLAGVTQETAESAGLLLDRLNSAAFSTSGSIDGGVPSAASMIAREIDVQAVKPVRRATSAPAMALVIGLLGASWLGALPDGAASTFKQGVQAYDHAAFTTAERLFSRVVARAPRASDAWANLGAAAWSGGDSAGAVRAWQRTLRLDPLDAETRDRLEAIQPPLIRSTGYVPPLPVNLLAMFGLATWLTAWVLLIVPPSRRPENARAIAGGALTIAILLVAGAVEVRDRLDPRGLAVLRSGRLLLEAPGSQSARASGTAGETGLLGVREGAWVRIELDGSRDGWVPVASVLPLEEP